MIIGLLVLATITLAVLAWIVWILSNIRADQMIIRSFIANQIRTHRASIGAPIDDSAFLAWLQSHPDRPRRDDPPAGRIR
jgi:hypothetical protein